MDNEKRIRMVLGRDFNDADILELEEFECAGCEEITPHQICEVREELIAVCTNCPIPEQPGDPQIRFLKI